MVGEVLRESQKVNLKTNLKNPYVCEAVFYAYITYIINESKKLNFIYVFFGYFSYKCPHRKVFPDSVHPGPSISTRLKL